MIFGLSSGIGRGKGVGGAGFSATAYFFCMAFDKKVWKITPSGTATVFKDYASASREPYGVAVDNVNGRLFVLCGDTAAQYQIDRFDDLSVDTGATAAATISSHTQWGGKAFYHATTDELYWSTVNGTPKGFHKVDGDLTTVSNLYSAVGLEDVIYWPPDDEVYGLDTVSTDELYTGELDGTSWADSGGNFSGTVNSIVVPPAHLMGTNSYIIVSERVSGRLDRYTRAGASRVGWLDVSVGGGSTLKLLTTAMEIDHANSEIIFAAHANGGTGVDGIYKVTLQEAAHAVDNCTLITGLTLTGNQTSGQDMSVWYTSSEVPYLVDVQS